MSVETPPVLADDKVEVLATVYDHSEQAIKTDHGVLTREEAQSLINPVAEKMLVRKLDIRVLLPIAVIFFWAFVNRVNLGYARLQGLEKDLGMAGNDFNVALLLGGISLCWGFMTLGQGLIKTYQGLIVLRVFLGLFESGLVPGAVYLTSMYYTRFELQKRMVALYIANCLAIGTGGLIAYGMNNLQGVGGYNSWRWIFIIEGIVTIGPSVILIFIITDWPSQAKWLSPSERKLLVARQIVKDGGWTWPHHLLCRLCVTNATAFVPSIIARLGYTDAAVQAYTIPIYVVAAALAFLAAVLSDHLRNRFVFCFFSVVLCVCGYAVLLNQHRVSLHAQYGALFLFNGGSFMVIPTLWTWLSNNMGGHYKRAWSSAAQIGLGNAGAIVPTMTFISTEAPSYTRAYTVCLSLIVLAGILMILTELGLCWENRLRDAGKRDYRLCLPPDEVENLGDDDPSFRFAY